MATAAKKRRPTKVLSAVKHLTKGRQALYDTNVSESPLLGLPPELRNRIWRLVLCSDLVLIGVAPGGQGVRHFLCGLAENDLEYSRRIKTRTHGSSVERYEDVRDRDILPWKLSERLPVLATCRQIHQEAALLPFTDTWFSFLGYQALHLFLKAVVPSQAQAIPGISIVLGKIHNASPTQLQKAIESKLQGFQSLVLFREIRYSYDAWQFIDSAKTREAYANTVIRYHRYLLNSVSVSVYCAGEPDPEYNKQLQQQAEAWEKKVEKRFLIPWNRDELYTRAQKRKAYLKSKREMRAIVRK